MIERVARAIFEAEYTGGEADEIRWERNADIYCEQARAAIRAMREPTDTMVSRGVTADDDFSEASPEKAITVIFTSMIDAALTS